MGQHIKKWNVSITFVITIIILLTLKISVFSSIREHCKKMKQKNRILIIFFIMTILPGIAPIVASAATPDIYVNQTGWWRADGAFNASATRIQAAINNATTGDTIYVYNGSYIENVNVNKQVTLQGEGAGVVTIIAALTSDHVFDVSVDYVNLSGFNVTGATGGEMAGIYLGSGVDHANISDNNASNNYYAIYLNSSSNNNLTNNSANSNNNDGIKLNSSSNNNTVTNNTANSNNIGIGLMTSSKNNTVTNNNANLNIYGIFLNSASNNTIYNNYFNNTNNAQDNGYNVWNTTKTAGMNIKGGPWLGGNYWSNYMGEDTDGDRLGDTLTPYNSSGNIANGGDYHPLMTADTIPATTTTPTGSGGGGSGGSGVVTAEPSENIAGYEMIERNLEAGKPVTYTFTKNQDIVYEVSVTGKENEYDVSMRIEILKDRSKQAKENAPGLVYRNANIISGTKNIGENVIKFKVNDSWLPENGFDASDIRLVKWVDNKWITLETGVLFNKDGYTHFSAKSMTFSTYAITGIKKEEMMPASSATEKTAVIQEATPFKPEEPTLQPEGKTSLWIWMTLAVLLIAAVVYVLKRR